MTQTTNQRLQEEAEIAYETFYQGEQHTEWERLPQRVRKRWVRVTQALADFHKERGFHKVTDDSGDAGREGEKT